MFMRSTSSSFVSPYRDELCASDSVIEEEAEEYMELASDRSSQMKTCLSAIWQKAYSRLIAMICFRISTHFFLSKDGATYPIEEWTDWLEDWDGVSFDSSRPSSV